MRFTELITEAPDALQPGTQPGTAGSTTMAQNQQISQDPAAQVKMMAQQAKDRADKKKQLQDQITQTQKQLQDLQKQLAAIK
jgi:hypothetical protein